MQKGILSSIIIIICALCTNNIFGADFLLMPNNGELITNCPQEIDIMIKSKYTPIILAELGIWFEDQNVDILGFFPSKEFNMPEAHKSYNNNFLYGYSASMEKLTGTIHYGTILISPKINSTGTKVVFDKTYGINKIFDDKANDVLRRFYDGEYVFVDGDCPSKQIDMSSKNHLSPIFDANKNRDTYIKSVQKKYFKQDLKNYRSFYILGGILFIIILFIIYKNRNYILNKTK